MVWEVAGERDGSGVLCSVLLFSMCGSPFGMLFILADDDADLL